MSRKSHSKSNGKPPSAQVMTNSLPAHSEPVLLRTEPRDPGNNQDIPEGLEEMTQAALEEIWARRAQQIAHRIEDEAQGEQIEIALLRMGRDIYGIDAQYVYDIRPLDHITHVPRVPEWVAGVVNLRGRIVSVINLKRYLGFAHDELTAGEQTDSYLVVVEVPEMELALVVDEVLGIENIRTSMIQEATTAIRGIRLEYLRGIVVPSEPSSKGQQGNTLDPKASPSTSVLNGSGGRTDANQALILILELPVLLADKQLIIHEEIM